MSESIWFLSVESAFTWEPKNTLETFLLELLNELGVVESVIASLIAEPVPLQIPSPFEA